MRHPRRFFRSSLLTAGALVAGTALAVPSTASAFGQTFPSRFDAGVPAVFTTPSDHVVRVVHGLPQAGVEGVVRVDVDDDQQLRFTEAATDGTTLRQRGTPTSAGAVDEVRFVATGHLSTAAGTATAAVVRRPSGDWFLVVYGADDASAVETIPLPAEPNGLAFGSFLAGDGQSIAVAVTTNETVLYHRGANAIAESGRLSGLTGPLTPWRFDGTDAREGLVARQAGATVTAVVTAPSTFTVPQASGTPPTIEPFAATASDELDASGRRWGVMTNPQGKIVVTGYSAWQRDTGYYSTDENAELHRAFVARFGRLVNGVPARDAGGAFGPDGVRIGSIDGNRNDWVPGAGATEGTVADVDGDGRDDLVSVVPVPDAATSVVVRRNTTGDEETRAPLRVTEFSPAPRETTTAGEWIATAGTVTWTARDAAAATPAEYRCALDGGADPAFAPCAGTFTLQDLQPGWHTFRVERRAPGYSFWAPATVRRILVPAAAPTFVTPPPLTGKNPTATVEPRPGSRLQCRDEGGYFPFDPGSDAGFVDCANPYGADLSNGRHTIAFRWVTDDGAPSEVTRWTVTVDGQAPPPPFVLGPPVPSTRTSTAIGFLPEPGATAECRVEGEQEFTACPPGRLELTHLRQGTTRVEIRQTDAAGNTGDPAVIDLVVLAPAAPRVDGGPTGRTEATSADFTVVPGVRDDANGPQGDLECALDGDDWAACSGDVRVTGLSTGEHVLRVRQVVDGTNATVVERRWTVGGPEAGAPAGPAPVVAVTPAAPPAKPAQPAGPAGSLKAPKAPVPAKAATVTGRALSVGCAVPGATDYRCVVTVTKGGKQLGRAVRTGDGAVQVKLTREGARKVQRLGGLTVKVKVRATAGDQVTTTTKTVRILPTKVLVVPTDGLFAFASADPTEAGTRLARTIASQLHGARELTIVGHTDDIGGDAANERLGLRRAKAFAALLRREGLGDTKVVVRSAGEGAPRVPNHTARGRQLNRRVEVTVRY